MAVEQPFLDLASGVAQCPSCGGFTHLADLAVVNGQFVARLSPCAEMIRVEIAQVDA